MEVRKEINIIISDKREIRYLSNIAELARRRMAELDSHTRDTDIEAMGELDLFLTKIFEATT